MVDLPADSKSAENSNLVADDLCRRDDSEAQPDAATVSDEVPAVLYAQPADVALAQPGDLSAKEAEVIQMVSIHGDRPESQASALSKENNKNVIKIGERVRIDSSSCSTGSQEVTQEGEDEELHVDRIPRRGRRDAVDFTTIGVLKRETFTVRLSTVKSTPKWNLTERPKMPAILDTPAVREERRGAAPAPWRYTLPPPDKTRTKAPTPNFGGTASRFGRDDGPDKFLPGPGHYLQSSGNNGSKWRFGSEERLKNLGKRVVKPGPGAHDVRRKLGHTSGYSMMGRPSTSQLTKSWSSPGPGFYSPQTHEVFNTAPQPSFGTTTREQEKRRGMGCDVKAKIATPGPGTYDHGKKMGQTGVKYSMALRQYYSDVPSRYSPGPGSYNAHTTSFGY